MADDPSQTLNLDDLSDRALLLMIIAKQGSLDARIQVIEDSGIWKATHDQVNASLRIAASYERIVELVDEAMTAVRREGVKSEQLKDIQADVERLLRRTAPPGTGE